MPLALLALPRVDSVVSLKSAKERTSSPPSYRARIPWPSSTMFSDDTPEFIRRLFELASLLALAWCTPSRASHLSLTLSISSANNCQGTVPSQRTWYTAGESASAAASRWVRMKMVATHLEVRLLLVVRSEDRH